MKLKMLVRGKMVRWYLIKLEHTPTPARLLEKWGNITSVIRKGENEWFGSQEGKQCSPLPHGAGVRAPG